MKRVPRRRIDWTELSPAEGQAQSLASWAIAERDGWTEDYTWPDGTIGPEQRSRFLDVSPEEYDRACRASRQQAYAAAIRARLQK